MKIPSIIEIPIGEMLVNEHNPRTISPSRMDDLIVSILTLPKMLYLRPTVASDDNIPLGGNMRTEALRQLSKLTFPDIVTRLEHSVEYQHRTPATQVETREFWRLWVQNPVNPVIRASELDPDEVRSFIIKDNTAFGEYDVDMLANEFDVEELLAIDPDLLPQSAADATAIENGANLATNEDDFDENTDPVETRVNRGDLWRLGQHLLLCGDATNLDDIKRLMNGDVALLVVTDPPYNVGIVGGNHAEHKENRKGGKIANDAFASDEEAASKLWLPAFENMRSVADAYCSLYCTMPQGVTHTMMMMMMMMKAGWTVKHELIWRKQSIVLGRQDYNYQHEPICFGWNEKHRFIGNGEFAKTSVWEFDRPTKSKDHPTMKPVGLFGEMMLNSSRENDIVLDPFAGSGTTMIAAEQLNRRARCMEIDPHYCDVIIARWEKETGAEAVKL